MELVDLLGLVDTAAFFLLGLAALRRWHVNRDRPTFFLALALSAMAGSSILGRINDLLGIRNQAIQSLTLLAFLSSGYFIVRLRDQFISLHPKVKAALPIALGALGAVTVIVGIPAQEDARFTGIELALALAVVVTWSICAGEPVIRFLVASRNLPRVQRARLRALGAGLGGIILILFILIAIGPAQDPRTQVAFDLIVLALVPLLYVALEPPRWLRKTWESDDEGTSVAEDLAVFAPDAETISNRVLGHALSIVGADAGYVRDVDGSIIAMKGMTSVEADEIEALARDGGGDRLGEGRVVRLTDQDRYAVVLPFQSGERAALGVVSGPFTPLFGSYETQHLREFGAVAGVALDRVRLVEALADETDRYQALLQAISDLGEGFLVAEGARLIYANDAYCAMTGYTIQELKAMPSLLDIALPAERGALRAKFQARMRGEPQEDHYESAIVRKDGSLVYVEVSLKLIEKAPQPRMITIVRDVTSRKLERDALARQTGAVRLLQSVAEAANEARQLSDAIRVAIDEVCAYSRWPVGHALLPAPGGRELLPTGIWHLDDADRFAAFKERTEASTIKIGEALAGRVMESGRPIWIADISSSAGFDRGGLGLKAGFAFPILIEKQTVGVLEFYTEEMAEPDENLLDIVTNIGAQLGRAAERERINTLRDEFISNAAHELRTPITSIVGFSALLKESDQKLSEEELRLAVQSIARQGERLRGLVNNLLDFTRVQQGRLTADLKRVDVRAALVNGVEVAPPPDARKVVEVRAPEGMVAMADAARLEQILANLLTNAYRYGGDKIVLDAIEEEDDIIISVADDGPGIQSKLVDTLFDPFTRGETSNTEGSGLGLAIVRMLAQIQGGDIEYRAADSGGAEFLVRLGRP